MNFKEFILNDDYYEVIKISCDENGTSITIEGIENTYLILFGFVRHLSISDEGARIKTYYECKEIQKYRENKFYGKPLFLVNGEDSISKWLLEESGGFSQIEKHYMLITINHIIDIFAQFDPKIEKIK